MENVHGVVAFDDRGAIKSWSQMEAVNSHNNRLKDEPHCDPKMPKPIHMLGSGDLITDVKALLLSHGVDPERLRKNAAIAYETILTASHAFFDYKTAGNVSERIGRWIAEAFKFAKRMWGPNRIASIVLHLDEYTPHMHVVIVPLVQKVFRRWPERGLSWTLNGRSVVGPGEFQKVHDQYAETMAPLGLMRGKSGSRAKYRPYAAELAELNAQKAAAAQAEAAAAHAIERGNETERQRQARWDEEFERLKQLRAEHETERRQLVKDRERVRIQAAWLAQAKAKIEEKQRLAETTLADASAERLAMEKAMDALMSTIKKAIAFRTGLRGVPVSKLPPETVAALRTVNEFEQVARQIVIPDDDRVSEYHRQRMAQIRGGR